MTIKEVYEKKKSTYLYFSELESLKAVQKNGYALQYVKIPTRKMTLLEIEEIIGCKIEIV